MGCTPPDFSPIPARRPVGRSRLTFSSINSILRQSLQEQVSITLIDSFFTLQEVAAIFRTKPRTLSNHLKKYPCGKVIGRKKISQKKISRASILPCHVTQNHKTSTKLAGRSTQSERMPPSTAKSMHLCRLSSSMQLPKGFVSQYASKEERSRNRSFSG